MVLARIRGLSTKVSQPHLYLKNVFRISKVISCYKNTVCLSMKVLLGPTPSALASLSKYNNKSLISMITKMIQYSRLKILTQESRLSSSSKTACWPWARFLLMIQSILMMAQRAWLSSTRSGSRILSQSSTLPQSK